MELEVLNDQLRKGQAGAEREAKSQQAASYSTSSELQKVSERLKAMPKRFTQSLSQLRDEVDNLESEKRSLELAKQRRTLKVLLTTTTHSAVEKHNQMISQQTLPTSSQTKPNTDSG